MSTVNLASDFSKQVREPGLANFGIGQERYTVRGGALVVIPLLAGDTVEIVDPEGLQCAHIVAFDSKGAVSTGQFSYSTATTGQKLAQMLKRETNGASKIRSKLKLFDMDLANAQAAVYLDGETLPGCRETLTCNTECIVIIGAPGEPMKVSEQNPPTDLIVWVTRSHPNQHIGKRSARSTGNHAVKISQSKRQLQ